MRTLLFIGALVLVGLLGPARIALPGPLELARDLEDVRTELEELRRVLPVQATDAGRLARFEVRLEQLEEEIRRLTGRIERLEFEDRQLNQRFDQLVGDLDDRLRGLEQGVPAGEGGPFPPDVPLSQGGGGGSPAMAAVVPPAPAPREGELGRVPESALEGLPRPDPSAATPPERSSLPPEEQYEQAMNQLRAGDYGAAEQGLELFVELNDDHPLAANAAYWLAETHYVRRNYAAAAAAFARNYRTYGRDAPKAADNLLKLGMSLQGLGESDKACLSFAELRREFPDAPAHIRQAADRERERAQCV
ncbi:MAG: tol-pal system protein YbgF [Geminicoccaceae bacterium]|nr:tol-pal system protein YbgF [Geminicoccaceae bacterium]